ncbi:CPBP family intramembrane metalloprotease [bacterium]|nr:CPBP family intramembrane metalloprotease [bacterium]
MPPPPETPQRPTLWEAWSAWQLMVYALLLLGANVFWQAVVFQLTGTVFLPVAVAGLLAIVLPLTGAAWWHGQSLGAAFDLRLDAGVVIIGIGAGLLAWLPASTLAGLSSELRPPDDSYFEFLREHLPTDLPGTLVAFGAAGVVAPFAEELLFRGLLYRTARTRWGPVGAAFLTSLFFGIVHWEPWSLFGLIAVGLVMCALYERTGSLVAPMLAHAVHNVISLALMLKWRDELGAGDAAGPTAWLVSAACTAALVWLLRRPRAR